MILGALGAITAVLTIVTLGYNIYDIISTGSWQDWTLFDWICNIGLSALCIFPFFSAFRGATAAASVARGGILARLAYMPVIGHIYSLIWGIWHGLRIGIGYLVAPFFAAGGFLNKLGISFATLGLIIKKPWVLMGLMLLSLTADGIFRNFYQLWGDLSLRAASVALDRVSAIMSDNGYGDPIGSAVAIMRGSKEVLPSCFTAVWGLVGASECIGLIITTFQYMFLLSALLKGFRVYKSYQVPNQ